MSIYYLIGFPSSLDLFSIFATLPKLFGSVIKEYRGFLSHWRSLHRSYESSRSSKTSSIPFQESCYFTQARSFVAQFLVRFY